MSDDKILGVVEVTIYHNDKPQQDIVGLIERQNYEYDKLPNGNYGWVKVPGTRKIFGRMYRGKMTYMCYYVDDKYFKPTEHIEEMTNDSWFYFDMGTTMPEIKISKSELEKAYRKLGMI